jgi:hypothetical protein
MSADPGGFLDDAAVGPVLEASMLARHVVVNGDMGANGGTSCMGCNSAPFVEDLDGAGSDADVDRMYSKASTTARRSVIRDGQNTWISADKARSTPTR